MSAAGGVHYPLRSTRQGWEIVLCRSPLYPLAANKYKPAGSLISILCKYNLPVAHEKHNGCRLITSAVVKFTFFTADNNLFRASARNKTHCCRERHTNKLLYHVKSLTLNSWIRANKGTKHFLLSLFNSKFVIITHTTRIYSGVLFNTFLTSDIFLEGGKYLFTLLCSSS